MLNTLLTIKEHIRSNNLLICNILKNKDLDKLEQLSIYTAFNNVECFINELININTINKEKPKKQYTKRKKKLLKQSTLDIITLRNEGKTYQEIAKILNISYKKAYNIVNIHKDLITFKEQDNEIQ